MSTYLYVKTHNRTGLKYLGKTVKEDPHAYPGSGVRWRKHLDKHGYDYSTQILRICESKEEVCEWGRHYSKLWNVIESEEWANLKLEEGDGGAQVWTDQSRSKMSKSLKGRTFSIEHRANLSKALKGRTFDRPPEAKAIAAAKASLKLKGQKKPEGFGDKIRQANLGKKASEEAKANMKSAWTPERRAAQAERRKIQNLKRLDRCDDNDV